MARKVIRKTARLASYYHGEWYVLYVQTPRENASRIKLSTQRHLINNLKLATELGAGVIREQDANIADAIMRAAIEKDITTVCIGKPHIGLFGIILRTNIFSRLLKALSTRETDLVILS